MQQPMLPVEVPGPVCNQAVEEGEDNEATLPGLLPPHCYSSRQGCGGKLVGPLHPIYLR